MSGAALDAPPWLAAVPAGTAGFAGEVLGLSLVALLRVALSLAALSLRQVSLAQLSRRLDPARAERWRDPVSRERLALALARALALAGTIAWAVSLAARAGVPRPGLVVFAVAAAALVVLVEGLLLPPLGAVAGEGVVRAGLPLLRVVDAVLAPLAGPMAHLRAGGREAAGGDGGIDGEDLEEELQAFIDAGEARGLLEAEERRLVRQIVGFGDTIVREVMTPRTEIVALSDRASVEEARRLFVESRHGRLPVYRGTLDDVVGILNVRDLLSVYPGGAAQESVTGLMRPVPLVPETRKVAQAFRDLQRQRTPLAVVVDEYGGTAGLVTIEDLLEEIVGEIKDEHEVGEDIAPAPDGGWLVSGLCSVDDLGTAVGRDLQRPGVDSVGGLVFSTLGRLPEVGETVRLEDLELEVLELDHRRVARLHVRPLPAGAGGEER